MSYLNGYNDRELIEEIPRFRLPLGVGVGCYRAFEIAEEAMLPLATGTTIIARFVDNQSWGAIQDGTPCIVVSQKEGILFRRVYSQGATFRLSADNPLFSSREMDMGEVLEIWEAKSYISSTFPVGGVSLEQLASMTKALQEQVKRLQS